MCSGLTQYFNWINENEIATISQVWMVNVKLWTYSIRFSHSPAFFIRFGKSDLVNDTMSFDFVFIIFLSFALCQHPYNRLSLSISNVSMLKWQKMKSVCVCVYVCHSICLALYLIYFIESISYCLLLFFFFCLNRIVIDDCQSSTHISPFHCLNQVLS